MAKLSKVCSIDQAFNFKQDMQSPIGHMEYLKIGAKEFFTDLELINPLNNKSEKIVGPVANIHWDGGKANPLRVSFNISTKNKQQASELIFSELSNISVEFRFVIYDYDPVKKAYYPCFHVEDNLKGIINKHYDELAININDSASIEVTSPKNYTLDIEIAPQPEQQILAMAFSQTAKMAKEWGVASF